MAHSNRYSDYLQSPEWRDRRDQILVRAGYLCEIGSCNRNASEAHHLTYERLYHEDETDLVAICKPCHDTLTDDECEVAIRCLEAGLEGCACPVCLCRKAEALVRRKLRERLAACINEALHKTMLRLYGEEAKKPMRYAGLRRKPLPAQLVCQCTGEPAGLTACACDACLWMRLAETNFAEEESDPNE